MNQQQVRNSLLLLGGDQYAPLRTAEHFALQEAQSWLEYGLRYDHWLDPAPQFTSLRAVMTALLIVGYSGESVESRRFVGGIAGDADCTLSPGASISVTSGGGTVIVGVDGHAIPRNLTFVMRNPPTLEGLEHWFSELRAVCPRFEQQLKDTTLIAAMMRTGH